MGMDERGIRGDSIEDRDEIEVEVGGHHYVDIEKVFGPLVMATIRIVPDTKNCEWVIFRENMWSGEWSEVCRIPGQQDDDFPTFESKEEMGAI
jgi:hypothetical protein